MVKEEGKILFRIDRAEPLPLARMAGYLKSLSIALANHDKVRLVGLREGSVVAELKVSEGYESHVWNRVKYPKEHSSRVQNNLRNIEEMLREDGVSAFLECPDLNDRIELATIAPRLIETYGPFVRKTAIEGQVVKIGVGSRGKRPGRLISVNLVELSTLSKYHCWATSDLIRGLRAHLFEDAIRVVGPAHWRRTETEEWEVDDLEIERFEELEHDKEGLSRQELQALAEPPPGVDPFEEYRRTHDDSEEVD